MSNTTQQTADEQITDWEIRDHTNDRNIPVESRSAGEDKLAEWDGDLDLELFGPDGDPVLSNFTESQSPHYDSGDVAQVVAEIVEHPADTEPDSTDLPDDPPIDTDPVDWLPSHFVDTIEGVPTVNRKGYCVIASKYGVEVRAEPITTPGETGFEYAEFRGVAVTEDGERYTDFGSAHVDRGDDPTLLGELAVTRAKKRATAWATGVGMTAVEELQSDL